MPSAIHPPRLGARSLAASPHLRRLSRLSLWFNRITDDGAAALLRSPLARRLSRLRLSNNLLSPRGRALVQGRGGVEV